MPTGDLKSRFLREGRIPPERDPLAGLENHPLFRDKPDLQAGPLSSVPVGSSAAGRPPDAFWAQQAHRLARQIEELEGLLEAEREEKRRLLRALREWERSTAERPPGNGHQRREEHPPGGAPRPGDVYRLVDVYRPEDADQPDNLPGARIRAIWEWYVSDRFSEEPVTKLTINGLPASLKGFLTSVKAGVQAATGRPVNEQDLVVAAIVGLRMVLESIPEIERRQLTEKGMDAVRPHRKRHGSGGSRAYCAALLQRLAQALTGR